LPIAIYEGRSRCVIRLDGDIDIGCSDELKKILIEAISTRKELQMDLSRATDLDITAIQLLWAVTQEAARAGAKVGVIGHLPESVSRSFSDAGFEKFPIPPSPQTEPEGPAGVAAESANDR
jgi:anti-anti-sigma regulatory factor